MKSVEFFSRNARDESPWLALGLAGNFENFRLLYL